MVPATASIESLVLIAGLSGAGRSSAQRVLSDLGYYAVDNLPLELLDDFLLFVEKRPERYRNIALHVDLATESDRDLFLKIFERLHPLGNTTLIFLDCDTPSILNRYNESRRPHPGFIPTRDKTLKDTIYRERQRYIQVDERASLRIDTSGMNIHQLKQRITAFIDSLQIETNMQLRCNFVSFGFKYGLPRTCDLAMDVRFLTNPHFVDSLRPKTGLDADVKQYVLEQPGAREFLAQYEKLLTFLLPRYKTEGKAYVNIAIGCTGGKHRSVAIVETLAASIAVPGILISTEHRDIDK